MTTSSVPTEEPPPRRAVIALQAEPARVRAVRQFARAVLGRWGIDDDALEAAILIVAELTANSAVHGHADMAAHLCLIDSTLHIEVLDYGLPGQCDKSVPEDEHGRGLTIVEALSDWCETLRGDQGWLTRARVVLTP